VIDRLRSANERATRTRDQAGEQLDRLRAEHELIDTALEAGELDRRRAGSLLAGGIAFRLFLWLLPAAVFAAGIIGLVKPTGSAQPDRVAQTLGLGASVTAIVRQATHESQQGTGLLLAVGLVLTLYASTSLVRALRIAHVLAWEEAPRRRPHLIRDGAILSVLLLATIGLESGVSYLRHKLGIGPSLLLGVIPVLIGAALWVGISWLLPHGDARWTALLPGAALIAVGFAALHFATVYYFAPKLTRSPALYGSLGTAATLLAWLFLISRVVVSSAFLNATLWRRRSAAASSAGDSASADQAMPSPE
jgi:uncharacterized BrkB/YihY/UPF0761 family membrane protein